MRLKWIVIGASVLVAIFGFSALLYACTGPSKPAAVVEQQGDTCDDLEDLVDTKEDDCGIHGSKKKSPTVKVTPARTTTKATPAKTPARRTPPAPTRTR